MLKFNDPLCHFNIGLNATTKNFWNDIYKECGDGGRYMIDFARIEPNAWIGRNQGEWTLPWNMKILDRFKMPKYQPSFKKTWEQITDERALEVEKIIQKTNKKFCILYSGGLDSTLITVALLKNLSKETLKNITFYSSTASVIEHPIFYKKYIHEKFNIINSEKYLVEDVINMGYTVISSAAGDPLCGSKNWLELQNNFYFYTRDLSTNSKKNIFNHWSKATDPAVHYSTFKDLIISFYSGPDNKKEIAEQYYSKIEKNIKTSDVPIQSLYDFYWWNLFNIKYIQLCTKWYVVDNFKTNFNYIDTMMFDWYNTKEYQQWSMANNNNGEKINLKVDLTQTTLKCCVRKYIRDFDKNDWYFHFKQKLSSSQLQQLRNVDHSNGKSPMTYFAVNQDLNYVHITDVGVKEYVHENLIKFKKDW